MQRRFSLLMFVLCVTTVSIWANEGGNRPSEDFNKDGFSYCWSNESAHTLKLCNIEVSKTGANIVIPSTVEYNGNSCTVITIADCCFKDVSGVDSITIPTSVKYIDWNAFHNCAVKKVIFLDGSDEMQVKYDNLGDEEHGMFYSCSNLTEVYMGRTFSSTYEGHPLAFEGDTQLKKVIFGPGITYIGKWIFKESGVTALDFSKATTMTSIYDRAFMDCDVLKTLDLTGATSLKVIHNEAFFDCNILKIVKFPPTLTTIGADAFDHWGTNQSSIDSIYFYGNDASAHVSCKDEDYDNFKHATYVYLDRDVYIEGDAVFKDCKKVDFGPHVATIAGRCFEGSNITNVIIPANIINIGYKSFYDCDKLTSIYIEPTSKSINFTVNSDSKSEAFGDCDKLVYTEIGRNVSYDTSTALNTGKWLNILSGRNEEISPFYNSYLTNVVIGDSVTEILPYMFECSNKLYSIQIGKNVSNIGYGAFKECDALNFVTFVPGTKPVTIQPYAHFDDYTSMSSFDDCEITTLNMGRDIIDARSGSKRIVNNDDASKLLILNIGDSVTTVPSLMFCDCTGLTELNVTSKSIKIETDAFKNCNNITAVTFGGDANIGRLAFEACTKLKDVTFYGSPKFEEDAFKTCSLSSVTVNYYTNPTEDAGYENSFSANDYSNATLSNLADNRSFKVDFSSSLPWSKFKKRAECVGNPTLTLKSISDAKEGVNYATVSMEYSFTKDKATLVTLPFNVDSYYFGSDADIYTLDFSTPGKSGSYGLNKLELTNLEFLPVNEPLLVLTHFDESLVQSPLDMFTQSYQTYSRMTYDCLNSSAKKFSNANGLSAVCSQDELSLSLSSLSDENAYVINNGWIKRINAKEYNIPAFSGFLCSDAKVSLSLTDVTGSKLLDNGFDITPDVLPQGYATFYNNTTDCEVVAVAEGGKTIIPDVYTVTKKSDTEVTLHKISDGVINKGQGVVLKAVAGVQMHLRAVTSASADTEAYGSNILKGVDVATQVDAIDNNAGCVYVLSGNSQDGTEVGVCKYSRGNTLGAHMAYIDASSLSNADKLTFSFDDTTVGVENVEHASVESKSAAYDLIGRKVSETRPNTIYVIDSKKIIKK